MIVGSHQGQYIFVGHCTYGLVKVNDLMILAINYNPGDELLYNMHGACFVLGAAAHMSSKADLGFSERVKAINEKMASFKLQFQFPGCNDDDEE